MESYCKTCLCIGDKLRNPQNPKSSLLFFEAALDAKCPVHKTLIETYHNFLKECSVDYSKSGLIKLHWSQGKSNMRWEEVHSRLPWNILLLKQDLVPNHTGNGRILDPDWIDLEILRKWMNKCLSIHGTQCENPLKIPHTQPAWLIDIESKCIVSGKDCTGYFVALSYRWGKVPGFQVNSDTIIKLQEPNALENSEIYGHLTPIIRHAMFLTSAIGQRYIWIDALCIVHGSDETKDQLNLMGAIYASAIVTIIATDGDSYDGFPGLRDVSSSRELEQRFVPFGKDKIIVNTNEWTMDQGTEYHDRGWTYQEYMMSKRRIIFNKKQLHWMCRCGIQHEENILGAVDKNFERDSDLLSTGVPDLNAFGTIVSEYNSRQLSYAEDALPGISGMLSIFSRSFPGGFLYGIPEMFFERGIGWGPARGDHNLRRRLPSSRHDSVLSNSKLPSWSWIGWQGLVGFGSREVTSVISDDPYHPNTGTETIPITQWYTSASSTGSPRRRIRSTWFEDRDGLKDFSKPLPPGWTRHNATKNGDENIPPCYPDGCRDYIFKHSNIPGKDWYYPFPVTKIDVSTAFFTPEQTPYLFCETKKARVWAHAVDYKDVRLFGAGGVRIGSLFLHNKEQLSRFPKETQGPIVPGGSLVLVKIDLVAIYRSRGYHMSLMPENDFNKAMNLERKSRGEQPIGNFNNRALFENYTVLWVEWKGVVAYRLASGEIDKAGWEKLNLENVSLVLG